MTSPMISLPIDLQIVEIQTALRQNQNLVLTAAPGAGKTTRIPPALISLTAKQVWILEPRRMAAVAAANRIADEQNWKLGEQVGYSVRFDSKYSKKTKIVFLTEALLARKMIEDPELLDCGIIVLDEFHERSIHVDLALGLVKELQMLSRPDLKIIVMSATLDTEPLHRYLENAPVVSLPGRLFEIEKIYSKQNQLMRTDHLFISRVVQALKEHLVRSPKGRDVLIFLPGMSEIYRIQKNLAELSWAQDFLVLPLSGSLALEDQLKALKPAKQRKIILSTNVAESSVTVDGIDTVIDSGLAREMEIHPKTGFERLELRRISKASAEQRAGRSGRQFLGTCIKLWAKVDEFSMPDFDTSELHRRDLSETVLMLHKLGISKASEFSWFESPDLRKIQWAENFLTSLEALKDGKLTEIGKKISEIPLPPRFAKLLLSAKVKGQLDLGAQLCALLQEKDILRESSGQHDSNCDLTERWEALHEYSKSGHRGEVHVAAVKTVEQSARHLVDLLKDTSGNKNQSPDLKIIPDLLLEAFPDRLCRRRKKENLSAVMAGGRGVTLAENSSAKNLEFFIALEVTDSSDKADSQVRKATGVTKEQIEKKFSSQFKKTKQLVFDENHKSYYFEEWLEFQGLPLEEPRRRPAKPDEIADLLPQIMLDRMQDVLNLNDNLNHWWERWRYFQSKNSDAANHLNNEEIKAIFEQACVGETKFEVVAGKDLIYFFENSLGLELASDFNRNCPSHFLVASGSSIKIHYHTDKNPHLEVRLQELFGTLKTPTIENGAVPITIHLLAPNYRPVQVTSDLVSFWDNIYPEVKRELKTRYPKHSWPDDPRTAPAQAKGRSTKYK